MNGSRFEELLAGALRDRLATDTIRRLQLALWHVLEACGDQGEIALEEWCAGRERRDSAGEIVEEWETGEAWESD